MSSPFNITLLGVLAVIAWHLLGCRRLARGFAIASVIWIWIWATPLMGRLVGGGLERPYLVQGRVPAIDCYPDADVIELHGGSMVSSKALTVSALSHLPATNRLPTAYADMSTSADRVWMAARLWKARKASKILVTSAETDLSTGGLLADFGVSQDAIVFDFTPRNTEEEAKAVAVYCSTSTQNSASVRPKVLAVTSAWHMWRTMMMYQKYAPNVEAIPVPCDFENTIGTSKTWTALELLPNPYSLVWNTVCFHEWVGILGYKWFRK